MLYSATTGQFYPNGASGLPEDTVSVPDALYRSCIGRSVEAGESGLPRVTLAQRKLELWGAIKAERDRRKGTGAKVGSLWFHTDADSRIQQLGLYTVAATGGTVPAIPWKTMNGDFVPLTNTLALQIFGAVSALEQDLFTRAETLRAQVYASANPESIDILAGWPQNYEESLL